MSDEHMLKAKWISLNEAFRLVEGQLGQNAKDEICDMANECKLTVRGQPDSLPYQLRYAQIGRKYGHELVAKCVDWENSASGYDDGMIAITRNLEVLNDDAFRFLLAVSPVQKQADECGLEKQATPSLQPAPLETIRTVIRTTYDAADARGEKPPNIKQLPTAVLPQLEVMGYRASGRSIQEVGESDEFKRRRRKPGKTVSSERRAQRK